MAPNNALVQDPGRPAATTSSTSVLGNGIVQARGAGVRNAATARPVDDEIAEFLKGEARGWHAEARAFWTVLATF